MSDDVQPRRPRRSLYHPRLTWRRTLALVAIAGVLLGAGLGVRLYLAVANATGERNPVSLIVNAINQGKTSTFNAQIESHNRINIALYGYGGVGHDGAYLTDSIMLISIQQLPGQPVQLSELSIPRDWYVPMDLGNGRSYWGRINEAYSDGQIGAPAQSSMFPPDPSHDSGAKFADYTLEHLLGVHIDYYVGVDFQGFKEAVDAVGGVDVTVPRAFTDPQYPAGECEPGPGGNCNTTTVHFNAGPQHMDGATALIYARSRHATDPVEATDFARSKRQQLILAALKDKVSSIPGILTRGPDLLNAFAGHYVTDLTYNDEVALFDLVKNVDSSKIEHLSVDDQNFLYECGYPSNCSAAYLFPHDTTYASLQKWVANELVPPATIAAHTPITVYNASGWYGASTRWASLLSMLGYRVTDGGAIATRSASQVINGAGPAGDATAQWLANYFTPSAPPSAPASPAAAGSPAGVTLILGENEEAQFNNQSNTIGESAVSSGPSSGYLASLPLPTQPAYQPATAAPVRRTPRPTAVATPTPKPGH